MRAGQGVKMMNGGGRDRESLERLGSPVLLRLASPVPIQGRINLDAGGHTLYILVICHSHHNRVRNDTKQYELIKAIIRGSEAQTGLSDG